MGHLLMSDKERQLKVLFEMVKQDKLTLNKVSIQIDIGYRQILRKYKRFLKEGDAGLVHKARGRVSNRQNPHREIIINRYQERYEDFGPTLAAEKFAEEKLPVDHEVFDVGYLQRVYGPDKENVGLTARGARGRHNLANWYK